MFTCRRTVFNHVLDLDTFISQNCFDLESKENKLTDLERIDIMTNHGIDESIARGLFEKSKIYNRNVSPMFPLLCKLYVSDFKYKGDGVEFFFKPVKYLLIKLEEIRRLNRNHYATLVLCLVNGNKISRNMLPSHDIKMDVYNTCGLYLGTPDRDIADAIDQMNGTYLTDTGSHFNFIHDSIFEVVAYHYGTDFPEQVIRYMPNDFIANKIKVCGEMQNDDLYIRIDKNQYQCLAERFYLDIELLELKIFFMNPALHDKDVLETFTALLDKKPYHVLADLVFAEHEYTLHTFPFIMGSNLSDTFFLACLFGGKNFSKQKIRVISWIIAFGHADLLKYFVESAKRQSETEKVFGSDIGENSRLLLLACYSKCKDIIEITLQHVCNESITTHLEYKTTTLYQLYRIDNPLRVACLTGDVEVVKLLIDNVKPKAIGNEEYFSLLSIACQCGHYYIARYLVESGADVNHEVDYTPLYWASLHGHSKIVQYLLEMGATESKVFPAINGACTQGCIDIVKMLVKAGSNINTTDLYGNTPLHKACFHRFYDIIDYLIDMGADIDKENQNGYTPLYNSSSFGDTEIVKYLLKKGACVNKGKSPLHRVCTSGNIDIVKVLVEAGCNINQTDSENFVPLYYASKFGKLDIVIYLKEKGAVCNQSAEDGYIEVV